MVLHYSLIIFTIYLVNVGVYCGLYDEIFFPTDNSNGDELELAGQIENEIGMCKFIEK